MDSRRDFLKKAIGATAAVVACSEICACVGTAYAESATPLGASGTLILDLSKNLTATQYTTLSKPLGSVKYTPPIGDPNHSLTFIITRKDDLSLVVFSNVCPHQGFPRVGTYSATTKRYTCTQHGSQFDIDGVVKLGPSTNNLTAYTVVYDGNNILKISGPSIVNSDLGADVSLANTFSLEQNFPNPVDAYTIFHFSLASDEQVSFVISDELGKQVAVVQSGFLTAGPHQIEYDASPLTSGTYFYKLTTPNGTLVKQLVKL